MSTTLMDADADTPVTLADCFHNPTSCQFLVVVLLRHLAWLPWRDHVSELQSCQVMINCDLEIFANLYSNLYCSKCKYVDVWLFFYVKSLQTIYSTLFSIVTSILQIFVWVFLCSILPNCHKSWQWHDESCIVQCHFMGLLQNTIYCITNYYLLYYLLLPICYNICTTFQIF